MAIINRHITYFVDDLKKIDFCGTEIFEFKGGSFELPFETVPTNGKHSFLTCENCCKHKEILIKEIEEKLLIFPFCCEEHRKLVNLPMFKKDDFISITESIANKIMFTYHHILNNVDTENWKKEIIDYIDYTSDSYGSFPYGEAFQLGNFYNCTLHLLTKTKNMRSDTVSKKELDYRLNFVNNYLGSFINTKQKDNPTDISVLLNTYQNWLNIFPFELNSYFGNLKNHFEKQLPFLKNSFEVNIYSGVSKARMHTKESLIKALINLTDNLLTQINGTTLYEKGLITDANKIKLELVINSRRLKLKKGYKNNSSTEEQKYRKMLKEWFSDEKDFINEITPLLKEEPEQFATTKSDEILVKNEDTKIFKNDFSFTLFTKMFELYKNETTHLANFSFLFFAMETDFLVCSQVEFVKFLEKEKYNISIDKIDNRQLEWKISRKAKLYNSIKEALKEKHEKSTN